VVLAGAAAAFFLWRRGRDEEPGATAASRIEKGGTVAKAAIIDAAPVAPADAAAAQDQVTIEFVIVPSTATVYADDQPLPDNKTLTVPRGETPVKIRIEAPDFASRTLDLVPNKDREVQIELLPRAGHPEELKSRPKTRPKRTGEDEEDPNAPSGEPADAGAGAG
jgi:hypothetical protein